MLTNQEYLLTKLAEECVEITQRCTKALCFGIDEVQPGQELNNFERIVQEVNDFHATWSMLCRHLGTTAFDQYDPEAVKTKVEKVKRFMEYSRKQGCLE